MKSSGQDYYLRIKLVQGTVWIKNLLLDYIVGGEIELRGQGQPGAGGDHKWFDELQGKAAQDSHTQRLEPELDSIYLLSDQPSCKVDVVYGGMLAQHIQQGIQGLLMVALGDELSYLFSV